MRPTSLLCETKVTTRQGLYAPSRVIAHCTRCVDHVAKGYSGGGADCWEARPRLRVAIALTVSAPRHTGALAGERVWALARVSQ